MNNTPKTNAAIRTYEADYCHNNFDYVDPEEMAEKFMIHNFRIGEGQLMLN